MKKNFTHNQNICSTSAVDMFNPINTLDTTLHTAAYFSFHVCNKVSYGVVKLKTFRNKDFLSH